MIKQRYQNAFENFKDRKINHKSCFNTAIFDIVIY